MIVGVSGGSGSGKTTVVNLLGDHLGHEEFLVLHLDHYYRDFSPLPAAERDLVNFDHPDSFDWDLLIEHVKELKSGRSINRPTYDYLSHTRAQTTTLVNPQKIMLIDGILALYHEDLRSLYDLSLYIDVADDLRFIRRLQRDIKERGRTMTGVTDQYLDTVRPMHKRYVQPQKDVADMIIDWESYNTDAIKKLSENLK